MGVSSGRFSRLSVLMTMSIHYCIHFFSILRRACDFINPVCNMNMNLSLNGPLEGSMDRYIVETIILWFESRNQN